LKKNDNFSAGATVGDISLLFGGVGSSRVVP